MPQKSKDWSSPTDRADLLTLLPLDLYGVRRVGRFVPGGDAMAQAWLGRVGNEEYSLRSLCREVGLSAAWYHRLVALYHGRTIQPHHILAVWEGLSGQREDGSLAMVGTGEEAIKARLRIVRLAVWYGQTRNMAEDIDYERTYVQKQLDRDRTVRDELIFAVSKAGIRPEWIRTGEGKMYKRGYDADKIAPEQSPFGEGELE